MKKHDKDMKKIDDNELKEVNGGIGLPKCIKEFIHRNDARALYGISPEEQEKQEKTMKKKVEKAVEEDK